MNKLVDIVSVLLMLAAAAAFAAGVVALANQEDLAALYWLVVGALALRSATDLLRPRSATR